MRVDLALSGVRDPIPIVKNGCVESIALLKWWIVCLGPAGLAADFPGAGLAPNIDGSVYRDWKYFAHVCLSCVTADSRLARDCAVNSSAL